MSFVPSRAPSIRGSNGSLWTHRALERDRRRPNPCRAKMLRPWLVELEARVMLSNWSGPLTSNTTFVNTQVQNIVGNVDVEPGVTLTVQPGTVVQFTNNTSLTIDGTLLAEGTASKTIVFTSVNDNSAMGGSNTAGRGNWGDIQFNSDSTGNMLVDADIDYGGGFGAVAAEVVDAGAPLTLASSLVGNSSTAGMRITKANPTLSADTFTNDAYEALSMDLDSNPVITGETAASFTGNGNNGLVVDSGSLVESLDWNSAGVVYTLSGSVEVPKGMTLTVGPGQIIKAGVGGQGYSALLTVDGTLSAQGAAAAPVIFTSIYDDSSGGNTDNDSTGTSVGHPGNWSGLQFNADSTNNVLDNVDVMYAGGGAATAAVYDDGGPLAISNSVVSHSSDNGLQLAQTNATLDADTFTNNAYDAVAMDLDSNPTITGETATSFAGNGNNGLVFAAGSLVESLNWTNPDVVYTLSGSVEVPKGMTLTVGPGQIIKAGVGGQGYSALLTVDGTLSAQGTAAAPVIFTSIYDDSSGGNTDNDSTGTSVGHPGNWSGLQFNADSTNNVLDNVDVMYAGGGAATAAVHDDGGPLAISNSVVSHSSDNGLQLAQTNATLDADTFTNNAYDAVAMDLDSNPTITGETATSFAGNGNNGLVVGSGSLVESLNWTNPDIVYSLSGSVTVPNGMTLTIGAGQVIKAGGPGLLDYTLLTVDGTLSAQGTAAAPVIFTSIRDDASGGNTDNDSTGTSVGNPGAWSGLQFNADSTNNVLDYVDVMYAGGGAASAEVYDDGGPLTLFDSVVSYSSDNGVQLAQSTATLSGDTITNNAYDAVTMDVNSSPIITGVNVSNNGTNGLLLGAGTLSGSESWNNPDIVYTLGGTVVVPAGMTLTIGAGQIIKAGGSGLGYLTQLTVAGTLDATGTAAQPIIFTSVEDNSAGGEATNNPNSTPEPGNWTGIQFTSTSTANVMDHVEVRYGGQVGIESLGCVETDGAP